MAELCVTASEFRVHMKAYGNQVSSEQDRIVVVRHDRRLFAVVSEEDFEFLQKHKPNPRRAPVPDPVPAPDIPEHPEHPDNLETEEIQRIYNATAGTDPNSRMGRWRGLAYFVLTIRGKRPERDPFSDWIQPCYTEDACASAPSSGPPSRA